MRLEIDNWRWSGVPFFIRAGKAMPGHRDGGARRLPHDRLARVRTERRPTGPSRISSCSASARTRRAAAHTGEARGGGELCAGPARHEFAEHGGEGPIAYEVLLLAAMNGDKSHFARQDALEETWRVVQPLIDARRRSRRTRRERGGPTADPTSSCATYGGWHDRGCPEVKARRPSPLSQRRVREVTT